MSEIDRERKGDEKIMKNVVVCKYGHYYNAELYSRCPHCDRQGIEECKVEGQIKEHNTSFEKSVGTSEGGNGGAGDGKQKNGGIGWHNLFHSSGHKEKKGTEKKGTEIITKEKAENISGTIQLYEDAENNIGIDDRREEVNIGIRPVVPGKEIMEKPEIEYIEYGRNTASVQTAYVQEKADDIGKTVMVQYGQDEGENALQSSYMTEPVAGWLVCVKGRYLGQSFVIKAGKSVLGRNADSDICVEESTVSHEQALIMFEPRAQQFYLKVMEKAAFMYVNKEPILERIQLNAYDCIEIGEKTAFIFVPLCGESFNWKNYVNSVN